MALKLPEALVDHIFDLSVAPEGATALANVPNLLSWALVSRRYLDRARSQLYRHVILQTSHPMPAKVQTLVSTIIQSPQIAKIPHFILVNFIADWTAQDAVKLLGDLLEACTRINSLAIVKLPAEGSSAVTSSILERASSITELSALVCQWDGSSLVQLLQGLTKLESLSFDGCCFEETLEQGEDDPEPPSFSLTRLDARLYLPRLDFQWITTYSHSTLTSLALPLNEDSYDLSPFAELQTLEIKLYLLNREDTKSFLFAAENVATTLEGAQHLINFSLTDALQSKDTEEEDEESAELLREGSEWGEGSEVAGGGEKDKKGVEVEMATESAQQVRQESLSQVHARVLDRNEVFQTAHILGRLPSTLKHIALDLPLPSDYLIDFLESSICPDLEQLVSQPFRIVVKTSEEGEEGAHDLEVLDIDVDEMQRAKELCVERGIAWGLVRAPEFIEADDDDDW